jgi:rhamnose transport system ATP-binding protein
MMVGRSLDALFPKLPATIGAPLLEVRGLCGRPHLRDIDIAVRRGEIVGLAGLVGSGRSELAQAIFGISPPERGQILLDGRPVRVRDPRDAIRQGIAYVPEDRGSQGLVRPMRLGENVSLAVLRRLARGGFVDRGAEALLGRESIERFSIRASGIEQVVGKLSGGNQQKVVLGKWLATKPKLLIMDEPTRGIDVGAKAEIHRLMSELAGQGLGVLMISSELPEIMGMSDRVLVMRAGRIVAEFPREHATQEAIAGAMMHAGASTPPAAAA